MTARRALGCPWSVLAPWVVLCSICISCSVSHIFIVSLLRARRRPSHESVPASCGRGHRLSAPHLPCHWLRGPPPSRPADQYPALLGQGAPPLSCPGWGERGGGSAASPLRTAALGLCEVGLEGLWSQVRRQEAGDGWLLAPGLESEGSALYRLFSGTARKLLPAFRRGAGWPSSTRPGVDAMVLGILGPFLHRSRTVSPVSAPQTSL